MLLLIAYGNSLRRDDGAGLALAEQLAERWQQGGVLLRHLAQQQLTPELALDISAPTVTKVLFVDTSAEANVQGTCEDGRVLQLTPIFADEPGRVVGHHLTPASLLLYAEQLYHHCPPAWLLTIPGRDFGFGEGFSTNTTAFLEGASTHAWQLYLTLNENRV